MGLVHGRELLIGPHRSIPVLALVALAAACGSPDGSGDAGAPDTTTPAAAPADTAVTLLAPLPEGGPMPDAGSAGGIPPYPGAAVHTAREQTPEMRSFQAFTPDSWRTVIAWYDSLLGPPAWSRLEAEDMVIYERGDDEAAITVSPVESEHLRPGVPGFMQGAATAIGAAWRPDPAASP